MQVSDGIKRLIDDHPDTMKAGSIANHVADSAYKLASARGLDEGSAEFADFVREQVESAPGVGSAGGGQPRERSNGGGGGVKLSAEEREIAKVSGISDKEYFDAKQAARREGVLGRYGNGNRGY